MFIVEEESDCLERDNTCTYNFFCGMLVFFLKYFDSLLTSFCNLARIRGGRRDMKVGLTISFYLLLVKFLGTWGINLDLILFLKVVFESFI